MAQLAILVGLILAGLALGGEDRPNDHAAYVVAGILLLAVLGVLGRLVASLRASLRAEREGRW